MKNFKRILMGLCVGGLLCLGVVILKPESHHDGGSGVITSNLTDLWANFIYLKGRGYLNIYPYGLELNLIGLLSSLSPHIKKKEDIYAFYAMESGYWIGYNLTPYYKYLLWQINIGSLYGIDNAENSIRERLCSRKRSYTLYGSDNIETPPLSADVPYHYKISDNAVWRYIPR